MSVTVKVDSAKCVGHGRCYELAPDVFGEDERGRLYLVMDYLEGPTLRDFLEFHRRLPVVVALNMIDRIHTVPM